MKYLAILIVCVVFVGLSNGQSKPKPTTLDCEKRLDDMDKAVERCLIVTDPNMRPFNSTEDFEKSYCEPYKGWVKTINNYKPCLQNFQKTVFGIIVLNMKRLGRDNCDTTEAQQNVLEHSECLIPRNKQELVSLANRVTIIAEYVAELPNVDDMIPGLCCGFQLMLDVIEREGAKICNNVTKKETGKFVRNLVQDAVSEAIDLMCGNFATIEICNEKVPEQVEVLKDVLETNTPVYNHTAFPSLLRFIKKLDSQVNF